MNTIKFATGLTSIEEVVEYLCDPDNDSLDLEALRVVIREWGEGRIAFWLCNWRNMGAELMTYGTKNVASMLYGAAARAAKALGYKRLITSKNIYRVFTVRRRDDEYHSQSNRQTHGLVVCGRRVLGTVRQTTG